MDIQEIYALMERFDASALSRMKLETGEVKLTLEKVSLIPGQSMENHALVSGSQGQAEKNRETQDNLIEVKAPFVGTFYQAPSPEENPFVTPGQSVKKGEVIGIIEAMKMMNEIVAPQDGVIAAILVEDGSLVEYNQVLITLK